MYRATAHSYHPRLIDVSDTLFEAVGRNNHFVLNCNFLMTGMHRAELFDKDHHHVRLLEKFDILQTNIEM